GNAALLQEEAAREFQWAAAFTTVVRHGLAPAKYRLHTSHLAKLGRSSAAPLQDLACAKIKLGGGLISAEILVRLEPNRRLRRDPRAWSGGQASPAKSAG